MIGEHLRELADLVETIGACFGDQIDGPLQLATLNGDRAEAAD